MKHLLLATSALVGLAGAAAAEVSVSGDARIGLRYDDNVPYNCYVGGVFTVNGCDRNTWNVISRARVKFAMTGETDSGLSFGANVRADQAATGTASGGNRSMYKGNVFISGAYGKLTAGDVDSALENAVGDLPEIGLSGLNYLNEFQYSTSDFDSEEYQESGLLYEYKIGDASIYASFMDQYEDNSAIERGDAWSLGAGYTLGNYTFGIGYEKAGLFVDPVSYAARGQAFAVNNPTLTPYYNGSVYDNDNSTWGISGGTSIAGITFKAIYTQTTAEGSNSANSFSVDDYEVRQYGIGAEYKMANGIGLAGFYRKIDGDSLTVPVVGGGTATLRNEADMYGLGASYDLGGGAVVKGGIAHIKGDSIVVGQDFDDTIADFGLALTF